MGFSCKKSLNQSIESCDQCGQLPLAPCEFMWIPVLLCCRNTDSVRYSLYFEANSSMLQKLKHLGTRCWFSSDSDFCIDKLYSIIVNSPRPIQNLAFSWGGLPGKVAPTCVHLRSHGVLHIWDDRFLVLVHFRVALKTWAKKLGWLFPVGGRSSMMFQGMTPRCEENCAGICSMDWFRGLFTGKPH